jgi:alkyl hydroperoxide reductase subunit AhpF
VLLREADRQAVRKHFEDLAGPVSATLYSRPERSLVVPGRPACRTCPTTEALLREVEALSEKFRVAVRDVDENPDAARDAGIGRLPAIELSGAARGTVRFVGLPDGHEFGSLITAATWVSGAPLTLSEDATAQLAMLRRPLHLKVFTTPT